jgi:hypothetical protein
MSLIRYADSQTAGQIESNAYARVSDIHTRTANKQNSASFRDNNAARTNNIGEREAALTREREREFRRTRNFVARPMTNTRFGNSRHVFVQINEICDLRAQFHPQPNA